VAAARARIIPSHFRHEFPMWLVLPVALSKTTKPSVHSLLDLARTESSIAVRRVKQFVEHEGKQADSNASDTEPVQHGDD
jgi:hypothetical protein